MPVIVRIAMTTAARIIHVSATRSLQDLEEWVGLPR
jgi:hypothetical protein